MEQYLSAAEVASLVGVHYRTIENWASQGYLARENGKYGLISAFRYKMGRLEDELQEIKHDPQAELKRQELVARVEKEKAIARIKNLEADLLEGRLVDAIEVLSAWKGLIAAAKSKFLALPAKLALELTSLETPEEIQVRLTEVIDESLTELVME